MNPPPSPITILVAGVEFGWGSAGKLSAVLAELRARAVCPLRFVLLGSELGRPLLTEHGIDRYYDVIAAERDELARIVELEHPATGLVVLDPALANALEEVGVPTTFVDSLPFLWTDGDLPGFPLEVSVYCAQRCSELPEESLGVLSKVRNLRWVDAVVTPPVLDNRPRPSRGRFRQALVSLGGLRAPHCADWTAYPRLVIPPLLDALGDAGIREVHVAGNLPPSLAEELTGCAGRGLRITVGALSHAEFLDRLNTCDLLLASPGLTTLLEAGSRGTPVVGLPPQNLSQVFNGRFLCRAAGQDVRVVWPEEVFMEAEALASRAAGETASLELIYGGIARAAEAPASMAPRLRQLTLEAVRTAAIGDADWGGLARTVGTQGAAQVAGHVLEIANAGAVLPIASQ
ncbi:MAG: hydroxymethylcytosylglucuronate/cytosylglucuronate synthase [Pseudonocardiaceae bacterium]